MAVYPHPVVSIVPAGRQVGDNPDEFRNLSDLGLSPIGAIRLPVAPKAFYGVRRLASYDGPALRVRRAPDNAEADIGFAGNALNTAALEAFRGTGSLFLAKLYDQSGNRFDAVETNPANQCPVDLSSLWGGTPCLCVDGRSGTPPIRRSLTLPSALAVPTRNASIAVLVAPRASRQNGIFLELGSSTAAMLNLFQNSATSSLCSFSGNVLGSAPAGTVLRAQPVFAGLASSATERRIHTESGVFPVAASGAAATTAGGTIGAGMAGPDWNGKFDLFAAAVFETALTDAEMAAVRDMLFEVFPSAGQAGVPLVFEGDSITEGWSSTLNRASPRATIQALPKPVRMFNAAISGTTLTSRLPVYAPGIAPLYAPGGILVLALGRNDIGAGRTAAQILEDMRSYCTQARETGFRVVLRTILPRNGETTEAVRTAVNTEIRAGLSGLFDALSDVAADPVMSNAGDSAFYVDGLHPSNAGAARIGALDAAAIASLL